ncbi:GNAT family N-acetyltransferase [Dactylosporangium sp. NPDC005555]|uniref:GNAT family N-acetyltransferase n=1 Tax=Dactylosporangium sp. NPDC005555 TaxID=3154889 RepID=UPI0033AA47F8
MLTPLCVADADVMVGVLGAQELHEFIGGRPADLFELRRRYERMTAGPGDPDEVWLNWIMRRAEDGVAVGTVQATVTRDAAEVAWVVGVPWQGRGYAAEAAAALVDRLFAQGVHAVTASIHPEHHASAAVAAKAGLVATDRVVDGERIWQITRGPNSSVLR